MFSIKIPRCLPARLHHSGGRRGNLIVALIVGVVLLMNNSNLFGSRRATGGTETPLDILKRRYAKGDITTDEYEERKRKLDE